MPIFMTKNIGTYSKLDLSFFAHMPKSMPLLYRPGKRHHLSRASGPLFLVYIDTFSHKKGSYSIHMLACHACLFHFIYVILPLSI